MVVLFNDPVLFGLVVPRVQAELPAGIGAAFMDPDKSGLHQGSHAADAVQNIVVCGDDLIPAVPPDGLDKRCGRRVYAHGLNVIAFCEPFQLGVVLLVGALHPLFAAVEITLPDTQGLSFMITHRPMEQGLWVP